MSMISYFSLCFFFFNATATTEIYTLSLHDALPIFFLNYGRAFGTVNFDPLQVAGVRCCSGFDHPERAVGRSEEHTSELQSLRHLVCRLLLEKKKKKKIKINLNK